MTAPEQTRAASRSRIETFGLPEAPMSMPVQELRRADRRGFFAPFAPIFAFWR